MSTVLRAPRSLLFSPQDLRAAVNLVHELSVAPLNPSLYRALLVQRLGGLVRAQGGCFQKISSPSPSNVRLTSLHHEGWNTSDTEHLVRQLNRAQPRSGSTLLTSNIIRDVQKDREVHYVSSVHLSSTGDCLALSFKRTGYPFSNRDAVLVQTFHESLIVHLSEDSNHFTADLLSLRKRQVLTQLLTGKSEKQIAAELNISKHTVHIHVKSLYRTYDVNSRAELISHSLCPNAAFRDAIPAHRSMSVAVTKKTVVSASSS